MGRLDVSRWKESEGEEMLEKQMRTQKIKGELERYDSEDRGYR